MRARPSRGRCSTRLALPVGHRRRDAVDDQAHAANAEGRAHIEAADRQLQILRVVLPVQDADSGNARQRFREVDLGPAFSIVSRVTALNAAGESKALSRIRRAETTTGSSTVAASFCACAGSGRGGRGGSAGRRPAAAALPVHVRAVAGHRFSASERVRPHRDGPGSAPDRAAHSGRGPPAPRSSPGCSRCAFRS